MDPISPVYLGGLPGDLTSWKTATKTGGVPGAQQFPLTGETQSPFKSLGDPPRQKNPQSLAPAPIVVRVPPGKRNHKGTRRRSPPFILLVGPRGPAKGRGARVSPSGPGFWQSKGESKAPPPRFWGVIGGLEPWGPGASGNGGVR